MQKSTWKEEESCLPGVQTHPLHGGVCNATEFDRLEMESDCDIKFTTCRWATMAEYSFSSIFGVLNSHPGSSHSSLIFSILDMTYVYLQDMKDNGSGMFWSITSDSRCC